MDEGDVRRLLEVAVEDTRPRGLADGMWERALHAQKRQRLRAGLSAVCVGALVVTAVATTGSLNGDRAGRPAGPITSSSDTTQPTRGPQRPPTTTFAPSDYPFAESPAGLVDASVVQDLWTASRAESTPWVHSPIPRSISVGGATDLSTDPVEHALMAVQVSLDRPDTDDIFVLGDDMRWRRVEVPGLEPVADQATHSLELLRPTSLTRDGTMLALPQPGEIVVVDLLTGQVERYEVPGLNGSVIWSADGTQILTGNQGRAGGRLLSLDDGSVQRTQQSGMVFDTTFAPDGALIELHNVETTKGYHFEIRTDGGLEVPPVRLTVDVSAGVYQQSVHATDNAIAFVRAVYGWSSPRERDERHGVVVVDRLTGKVLAQLPMLSDVFLYESSPMGWLDDETLLLRLGSDVVSWHYPSGDLRRILTTEGEPVGLAFAPAAVAAVID